MQSRTTQRRLGLIGFFGQGNFGDELFRRVHYQQLLELGTACAVSDQVQAPYYSRPLADMVDEHDAIIIGGGDLIDPMRATDRYWSFDLLRKPVFVFGVSVHDQGQLGKDAVAHYREFFSHPNCHLLGLRDPVSYQWVREHVQPEVNLQWFPDPVCAIDLPPARPGRDRVLGVVLRKNLPHGDDLGAVRVLIDQAKDMGYAIKHIVLATDHLRPIELKRAQSLAQDDEVIVNIDSLDTLCQAISSCTLLASMKFHGLVLATLYGVPTISMWDSVKNRSFLELIERSESLCRYDSADLVQHLCFHPPRIPRCTRQWLNARSQHGYQLLRHEILQALG